MSTEETPSNYSIELETVVDILKQHLRSELESCVPFWDRQSFRNRKVNYFANLNVDVENDKEKMKPNLKNFNDLFRDLTCKRIVVSGCDGYGKSTMVQEMVHQWLDDSATWSSRFSLIFLFRLSEMNYYYAESLQNLFEHCLPKEYAMFVCNLVQNATTYASKVMLIFDGLDEFRNVFCEEINDIIVGKNENAPFVLLTTKPGDYCDMLNQNLSMSIRLNGFTEAGIKEHLGDLSVHHDRSVYNILKVPLLNVLYEIILQDGARQGITIYSLLERYVKLLARRYRRKNSLFSDLQETELIFMLGQAAQAKYSMIDLQPNVASVNFTEKFLNFAVSIGYIRENSTANDISFYHKLFADYFAARFWAGKNSIKPKTVPYLEMVEFLEPQRGFCSSLSTFSSFLSYHDRNYKLFLWHNFVEYVPLFDDYANLPHRVVTVPVLRFPDISCDSINYVISNLEFKFNNTNNVDISLYNVKFHTDRVFINLKQFEKMYLFDCLLKLTPNEFFQNYHIKELDFDQCSFQDAPPSVRIDFGDEIREIKQRMRLQVLRISYADETSSQWLNYVTSESTRLQELHLFNTNIDDTWMETLLSNETLLKSMRNFSLSLKSPVDLTKLLLAVNAMPNLTGLMFKGCYLSENELNILAQYFEKFAKKLKHLCLEDDENVGRHESLMTSVSNLTSLKHIEISNCKITQDSLDNLQKAFRVLRLEKCSFVGETVLNHNSNFLLALNSCNSLKEIIFDRCGFVDIELELSKNLLNHFSFESEKILRSGAKMDTVLRFYK